ncbi:sulfatase [Maribacter polysaccharolyticus]|uniref:sulfatase family protein n=1 Tax=Maribacter polysaccharolyticus TaxID=3020831 RepID=UPI00237F2BDC|nr:sulfatase [Maribacter polysaccharolyticus]MDE3743317.1 sulfatase [Maribacter polysaccharolyticus]
MKRYGPSLIILLCISLLNSSELFGQTQQPNFLILLGDDISAKNIGCYGSENPNTTPHIDKLANEGILFKNMFVSEAICAPTRAELYTGLTPNSNGCNFNHAATKKGTLSIVQHLSSLGYRVGLTGKRHFSPASVYPFEFIDGFSKNANYNGTPPERWDGVEEFMNRDKNQPFCLIICSVHAHAPWNAGDSSFWDPNTVVLPENFVDTKETREYFTEYLAEIRLFDQQVGKARKLLEKNDLDSNTALIVLDENGAGMPGSKWTTYDMGVRSACIMKWPNRDNTKRVTTAITQYCDILPTLIDAAGGDVPSNLDGKSLLPIIRENATTHREYAYFLYNNKKEGPEYKMRAVTDGRFKLIWNRSPDSLYAIRVINGFDYGYVDKMEDRHVRKMYLSWLAKAGYDQDAGNIVQRYRKHPEFELYDLNEDPEEMNNLVNKPELDPKLNELKNVLLKWMEDQEDRFLPPKKT